MGTFSWMFADEENRHNLQIGHRGYIALPDGNFLYEEAMRATAFSMVRMSTNSLSSGTASISLHRRMQKCHAAANATVFLLQSGFGTTGGIRSLQT